MDILTAILLGIIQGLTEYLPVSSTAHLTIAGALMGLISADRPEQWTAFIAVVQLGTMAAVLVYFRSDILAITTAFLKENIAERRKFGAQTTDARMGWYIILGSIPVGTVGLAFKSVIEGHLTKDISVIASSLIGLAIILWIAERVAQRAKTMQDITWRDALIVGIAQTLALIPGSSRSGTTITAGLFLGMRRDVAARFSFLLSIPAVLASGLLEFYEYASYMTSDGLTALAVATLVSALSGYAAIAFLLRFLKSNSTLVFILYRIILGLVLFGMVAANVL